MKIYASILPFFIVVLFSCLSVHAETTESTTLLQNGNMAYNQQNYELAITKYKEVMALEGFSAEVLFNLANSYAQTGKTGHAIANYKKAQLLTAKDPDIERNIDLVRKQAGLFDQEPSFFKTLINLLSCNQWAKFLLATLVLFVLLWGLRLLTPFGKRIHTSGLLGVTAIVIILLSATTASYRMLPQAIVVSSATLLLSPFEGASSQGSLEEGREVCIEKSHGAYSLVETGSNRGWVPTKSIETL